MVMDQFRAGIWAIIVIALIGGALAIGLDAFRNDLIADIPATSVVNESITLDNGVAVALANNYVVSVSAVLVNFSGAYQDIGAENYTAGTFNSFSAGTITLDDAAYDGNTSLVSYTYRDEYATESANSTEQGLIGAANATSYLGEIGVLIAIAVMIGIIYGAFYFFRT